MPDSTLYHILTSVAEGDETSFRKLFSLYKHRVYAYAMHFTHAVSASEEIVQDIFLKLWLHKESLGEIERFEAYLYTITRNLCFDYLKKLAHERAMKQEWTRYVKDFDESTEAKIVYHNYENLFHQALELLPPRQKTVYVLSFYQGQRHEEIAERLNISCNTVKVHLAKARAAVRKHLAAHLDIVTFLWVMIIFLL